MKKMKVRNWGKQKANNGGGEALYADLSLSSKVGGALKYGLKIGGGGLPLEGRRNCAEGAGECDALGKPGKNGRYEKSGGRRGVQQGKLGLGEGGGKGFGFGTLGVMKRINRKVQRD